MAIAPTAIPDQDMPPAHDLGERTLREETEASAQYILRYQVFEPLSAEAYAALKRDIVKNGMRVPVEVDEAGHILDGHNRAAIAEELGMDCPKVTRAFETDAEKIEYAVKANLLRRHIGPLQWARAFLRLMEVRGIHRYARHNRHTPTAESSSALAQEVGVNERTAQKRLKLLDDLAAYPDLMQRVDAGELTANAARREKQKRASKAQKATQTQPAQRAKTAKNQDGDTTASPGVSPVDQTSSQNNGTDKPAMAQDEPQNQHAPQDHASGSQAPDKTAHDTGDSAADPDNAEAMECATQQGEQGVSLDAVLAAFTQCFQQHIDNYLYGGEALHTFRAEIVPEHNSLWVVVTSTLSQPEDVTNRPDRCPGWGLHSASAEICNSCVYKARCEEAQTVVVGKEA
jgi:hypothetical protein